MAVYDVLPTDDGSVTCYHEETGELYHNRAGAYTEALVNYVEPSHALERMENSGKIRLLDVCFGLGYNTWVLLEKLIEHANGPFAVTVLAIENDPQILRLMPQVLADPRFYNLKKHFDPLEHNTYYQTRLGKVDIAIKVADMGRITIRIILDDLRRAVPKIQDPFDLVFHDPFAPIKVPELWSVDLFREYHRLLTPSNGRLLTYSSAGAVRGALREAGFHLYRTASLGRKLGGTLASVNELDFFIPQFQNQQSVFNLSAEEEAFLQTRSSIPYRDPRFNATYEEITSTRSREQQASDLPSAGQERLRFIP